MYSKEIPTNLSLAIAEVSPIGGSDKKGVKNNPLNAAGLQSSDRYSVPRVLSIVDRNSIDGQMLLCTHSTDGSARFIHNGMLATVTVLRQEAPYLEYTEHPATRGAFYLPRVHGVNDGAFGSKKDEQLPSSIIDKVPQRELFPEN